VTFQWIGLLKKILSKDPLRSVPVADDPSHRVHASYPNERLERSRNGENTLYDLVSDSFEEYADRRCLGERTFLGWKVKDKVKEFGSDITWWTYAEMGVRAHKFGAALKEAGVVSAPDTTTLDQVTTPCRIAIFENTCAAWMIAAVGSFTQAITVTTVYATLGIDAVVEAVKDNLISVIVCNRINIEKLLKAVDEGSMPTLTHIVYSDDLVTPEDKKKEVPKHDKIKVIAFEDFLESGDTQKYPPTPPAGETCAVVMYTSGSTGKPKGVIITHAQIVATTAAAFVALGVRPGEDVYLAYLPLAHILEMMAEFVFLSMGCTLCYADPKSLTATGSYPIGALEHYTPTLMAAVPKIWDTIKKGIQHKVAHGPVISQVLVDTALWWRQTLLPLGMDTPLFKALVFKKFAKVVGGKLRYALSGGGALNSEVHEYIRAVFGIEFVQGYVSAAWTD
jgi:long-chain acyl-CoA synthetase